jgi:hypothetical protein
MTNKKFSILLAAAGIVLARAALAVAACANPVSSNGGGGGGATPPATVTDLNLTSYVTKPVAGTNPFTTAINAAQYTGSVAWQTSSGAAHSGNFGNSTVYKAVVTLTAKSGYTFTGVAANAFSYSGATSVANTTGSTTVTVTITFPQTVGATVSIEMVTIPDGTFLMGSPTSEGGVG